MSPTALAGVINDDAKRSNKLEDAGSAIKMTGLKFIEMEPGDDSYRTYVT